MSVRAVRPLSLVAVVGTIAAGAPVAQAAVWSTVASRNPSAGQDVLNAAGRLPGTNVIYAVGRTDLGTLVERSANGGATWKVEPTPSPGTGGQLFGVAARAGGVWAVGYRTGPSRTSTIILRRKGGSWKLVPSPNPDTADFLSAVVTTPAGTWAVGRGTGAGGKIHPLILHWTGTAWKVQPAPALPKGTNELFGITGTGSDLWAFGQRQKMGHQLHPLALHHTASGWSVSKAPDPASAGESFFFGGAVSGGTVWAVGGRGAGPRHALVERHTAAGWQVVQVPDGAGCTATNELTAAAPIPGTNQVWAVGDCSPGLGNRTLIERRSGGAWHQVTSPTPDATGSFLTGVVAISANRAAAVGYQTPAGYRTLVEIYH